MATVSSVRDRVHAFVVDSVKFELGKPQVTPEPDPVWQKVLHTGTRLWLDTGDLEVATQLFTPEFEALTTNNTLLNAEVQKGIYDSLVGEAAAFVREAHPGISESELLLEIAFVLNAHHGLRLVAQFDARVSVELHTDLANDVERSVEYGKRFYAICPKRFIIKVPMTSAGFLSARKLTRAGIPVNFTLGFSARQNYLAALLADSAFVNVFMGRLGAFVADNKLGTGDGFGEKATLSTQRELLDLRSAGRSQSQLIGASMRKGAQVGELAGLDVFTMPPKVAADYRKNPDSAVRSRVMDDPATPLAPGATLSQFAGATLWEVPTVFRQAAEQLLFKGPDTLTADDVQNHFTEAGFGDLLPQWTQQDLDVLTREGKIPVLETWKNRLASGRIGLDALMNAAALCSFMSDQAALDNRVRSLL